MSIFEKTTNMILKNNNPHDIIAKENNYTLEGKILTVHGVDRDTKYYPNVNNFMIKTPQAYTNIESLRLLEISIPSKIRNFSKCLKNNTFRITFRGIDPNNISQIKFFSIDIEIPDGSYNEKELALFLTEAINIQLINGSDDEKKERKLISEINNTKHTKDAFIPLIFILYLNNINRFVTFCTHIFNFENLPLKCNENFTNNNYNKGFLYEIGYERNFNESFNNINLLEEFKNLFNSNPEEFEDIFGQLEINLNIAHGLGGRAVIKSFDLTNIINGDFISNPPQNRLNNKLPIKLINITQEQRNEIGEIFNRLKEGLKPMVANILDDFLTDSTKSLNFIYRITDKINNFRERQPIYMEIDCYNYQYDELNPFPNGTNNALSNNSNRSVNTAFAKIPIINNSKPDSNAAYIFESSGNEITFFESPLERIQNFKFKFRYHDGILADFDNQDINFSIQINELRDNIKRTFTVRTANTPT